MPRLAVVFDTNVYVGLSAAAFHWLAEREAEHSVHAFANYYVATELLANVALRSGPKYERSLAAIKRLWAHCKTYDGASEVLMLGADAEDQVAMSLFGRGLPSRREEAQTYGATIGEVANVESSSDWSERAWSIIDHLRSYVDATETGFVDSLWRNVVLTLQPDAKDWQDVCRASPNKEELLRRIDAGEALTLVAKGIVLKAGVPQEAPDPKQLDKLVAKVLQYFPTPVHLYSGLVRELIVNGPDMTKSARANSVWDLQVAFSTGQDAKMGPAPLWLITEDEAILAAAASAGAKQNVRSLPDYTALLGVNWMELATLMRG